jgi:hypothetical protein
VSGLKTKENLRGEAISKVRACMSEWKVRDGAKTRIKRNINEEPGGIQRG